MRRAGAALLLAFVGALAWPASPASAHICPLAAEIPVDQPASITVAAAVEATPVTDVEIGIPAELRVTGADAPAGWSLARHGQTLRYRGGPARPFTCQYFSVAVTATAKGAFRIGVVQRDEHGTVVSRTNHDPKSKPQPLFDQVVYAGIEAPDTSGGESPDPKAVAGAALIALGALLFAGTTVRSRRARRADAGAEELEARVAAFKQQVRDRS
jgi:hypothetical protein